MKLPIALVTAALLTRAILPGSAAAQENFYQGKTIRMIVGTSAGGGFDTYTRTIARHFGKHVPGQPSIVVENMAGAGHLIAANHMYRVAKPDGLTLGHFHGGWFLYQLFKRPGIEFDATKFEFIGSPIKESRACAFTKASGITSVERWLASKTPVKIGGIGGGAPDDMARMLAATTALPIQLVTGYKGTAEIRLAAESGELAGGCWTWDSIRSTWSKAIQSGEAIVVLQALSPNRIRTCPTSRWRKAWLRRMKRANCFRPASKIPPTSTAPTSPRRARPNNASTRCAKHSPRR